MSNNNTNPKQPNKLQTKPNTTSASTSDPIFHNSGIDIAANLGLNLDPDTQAIINLFSSDLPANEDSKDNTDIQDILKTFNEFPPTSTAFDINEFSSLLELNSPTSVSTPINYTEPNIQDLLSAATSSPTTFTPPPAPPKVLPKSKTMDTIPKATTNTPIRPMPGANPPLNLSSAVPIRAKIPNATTATMQTLHRTNSLQTPISTTRYRPQRIRPSPSPSPAPLSTSNPVGRPALAPKGVKPPAKKSSKALKDDLLKIQAKLSKKDNEMLSLLLDQCRSKQITPEQFTQKVQSLLGTNFTVDNPTIIKESSAAPIEQQPQPLKMRPQTTPLRFSPFQNPPKTQKQPQNVNISNLTQFSQSDPSFQQPTKPRTDESLQIRPDLVSTSASNSTNVSAAISISAATSTPVPVSAPQTAANNTFQQPKSTANPADDKVDYDALADVMNSVGVDLREETENIMKENDMLTHQSGLEHQEDHTRTQSFANTSLLAHRMALIAKKNNLTNVDIDAVNYLALACQDRLRTLLSSMINASKHRAKSNQFPEPPMSRNNTPLFKVVVSQDPMKQLHAINRADREEDIILKEFLKEKEEEGGEGPKTKKSKARKDGSSIGAAARNINEEQRRKTANATALLSAGGVQKSWMISTSTDSITPPPPPPPQPSRPPEPVINNSAAQAPKSKKPKAKIGSFLKDSSDKPRSYLGSQPLLGRLGSMSSHTDRAVTLNDAIFALENDNVGKFAQKEQRVLLKAYSRQWN